MTGLRRRLGAVTTAAALVGGTGLAAAVPGVLMAPAAAAHSVLVSVDPADGSELANSPEQVVLTFNEEVNQNFATVAVTAGEGSPNQVSGEPTVSGETVTAQVEDLEPGNYTIGYRVTSADGHVVSGSSVFSVVDSGAAEADGADSAEGQPSEAVDSGAAASDSAEASDASDAEASEADAEASDSGDGSGINPAVWVVGGIAVVLIGGAFFLLRRGN